MGAITLNLHQLQIPFRVKYGHAKAKHSGVASVVGILRDGDHLGYGEAVPRTYVTGETVASVMQDCVRLGEELREEFGSVLKAELSGKNSLMDIAAWFQERALAWIGPFPACAFTVWDQAINSLMAGQSAVPLYQFLGQDNPKPLHYTASIGFGNKTSLLPKLLAYKAMGLTRFKLKVGKADDIERLQFVKRILGNKASFYADANGAWCVDEAARNLAELEKQGIWAIEEPLSFSNGEQMKNSSFDREASLNDEHFRRYLELKQKIDMPIIADESLISYQSLRKIIDTKSFDMVNIRLSKCGGLGLAGEMIQQACAAGLRYGICAMVGESGILASQGSHFAQVHDNYSMLQGHSHLLLHKGKLTSGEASLGRRGLLNLNAHKSGLGLTINQQTLHNWTVNQLKIEL